MMTLRGRLYHALEPSRRETGLSPLNRIIVVAILLSVAFVVAESEPAVHDAHPVLFHWVEVGFGVLFAGGYDGRLRAFDTSNGRVLWEFDTNRDFDSVSGSKAHGGSIESAGPVVVDGALLVNSGYLFGGRMPGNVLLKFSVH
jgi:hypothetical protein